MKISMKPSNKTPAKVDETENQIDHLVDNAPWFSRGIDNIKNHILDKVVPKILDRSITTDIDLDKGNPIIFYQDDAKRIGRENGRSSSNQHLFQEDCRNFYERVITIIRKIIASIVKREKDEIEEVLKSKLPNMKEDIERKIDRTAVRKLMDAADRLNKTERAVAKFLDERGLNLDSFEAQKGPNHTHWKFWLPLLVILLIEAYTNYIFLGSAAILEKFLIAVTTVAVILGCGYLISACFKAKAGIRIRDKKYKKKIKKVLWIVVALVPSVGFIYALQAFIFYRAGMSLFQAPTEIMPNLSIAFNNNITDIGLAILNIFFLFVAIITFLSAGWRIYKYKSIAENRIEHMQKYQKIRSEMDHQARNIWDKAIESIKFRQKKASQLQMDSDTIKKVCELLPNTYEEVRDSIVERYEYAIKAWREGFENGRIADSKIAKDLSDQIPHEFRINSAITPLSGPGNSIKDEAILKALHDIDFSNDIDDFNKKVDEWEKANNKFNELSDFAEKQIEQQKTRIRKELRDDGIESTTKENEQPVDER